MSASTDVPSRTDSGPTAVQDTLMPSNDKSSASKTRRDLPSDVWQIISTNLAYPGQHIALSQTCTSARLVYADERVWQKLCLHLGIGRPLAVARGETGAGEGEKEESPSWREVFVRVVAHQGKCRVGYCHQAGIYARNTIGDLLGSREQTKQHYNTFTRLQHDEHVRLNKVAQEEALASQRAQMEARAQVQAQSQAQGHGQGNGQGQGQPGAQVPPGQPGPNVANVMTLAQAMGGVGHAGGVVGVLQGAVLGPGQGLPAAGTATANAPTYAPAGTGTGPTAGAEAGAAADSGAGTAPLLDGNAASTAQNAATDALMNDGGDDGWETDDGDADDTGTGPATPAGPGEPGTANLVVSHELWFPGLAQPHVVPGGHAGFASFQQALQAMGLPLPVPLNAPPADGPPGQGQMAGQQADAGAGANGAAGGAVAGGTGEGAGGEGGADTAAMTAAEGTGQAPSSVADHVTIGPENTVEGGPEALGTNGPTGITPTATPVPAVTASTADLAVQPAANANLGALTPAPGAPPVDPGATAAPPAPGTDNPNDPANAGLGDVMAHMNNLMESLFGFAPAGPAGGLGAGAGVNAHEDGDGDGNGDGGAEAGAALLNDQSGELFPLPWNAPLPPFSPHPRGLPKVDRYGKPITPPKPRPDLFPLSHSHWRNVPAAPQESNFMRSGGNVLLYDFLKGTARDSSVAGVPVHDRVGGRVDDWTGWSEEHERGLRDGIELGEHVILKFAFATNPPVTEMKAVVSPFDIKIANPTGITNQDVIAQLSAYLAKTMGPKERQKRLTSDSIKALLEMRKVKAGEIKTRLDLIKLADGSFGCAWSV